MDFYVNTEKEKCPKCDGQLIDKKSTNHDGVTDCSCMNCQYEWKENIATK